ncbi:hypothetical protein [Brochothrix thermosphacta]|uniref:hypothetical protein n=1 Tax=Brochothrix thermosphacta TaxID=2756 RepID=UPI00048B0B36|nr:hypothetical protein [Brochothrix thermosphacta]ODJ51517.1 hypothetical protein BFR34_00720 [Brochothrix thermosphacta DSM 20171 = FSL F6-1036]
MTHTLKNSFNQATLGSIIWIFLLANISNLKQNIPFTFIWNLLLIGILFGLVFGIIYPYLWNYSIFKASTNILISTVANIFCVFLGVRLYSIDMFNLMKPFWIGIILLTLIVHIIGFYFYAQHKSRQLKNELNNLI